MLVGYFDIFFFVMVVLCEIHWYRKSKRDDREFEAFKKLMNDQLLEINQRLEISIEKDDRPNTARAAQ